MGIGRWVLGALGISVAVVVACGDDTSPPTTPGDGGTGSGTTSSSGTSSPGSSSGASGTSGSGTPSQECRPACGADQLCKVPGACDFPAACIAKSSVSCPDGGLCTTTGCAGTIEDDGGSFRCICR